MPLIGAHVPVARGLATGGLAHAVAIGAEVIQVFASNPRGWAAAPGSATEDNAFRSACEAAGVPAYVHAPYLVNFGSPTPETVQRSCAAARHSLDRAAAIGARGVVIHTGSAVAPDDRRRAMRQVRDCLLPMLDGDGPYLLIEPTAGQGQSLCATVPQLGEYLDLLDAHPRVGVCLDTCHVHAAGHDLAEPGGAAKLLDELVATVGADRLRLIHANDSKDTPGSLRDRHEQIGAGTIGLAGFAELVTHPAVREVPIVIETPGDRDADETNIATLKELRAGRMPGDD